MTYAMRPIVFLVMTLPSARGLGTRSRLLAAAAVAAVLVLPACMSDPESDNFGRHPPPSRPAATAAPLVKAHCPKDGDAVVALEEVTDPYGGTLAPAGFVVSEVVRCLQTDVQVNESQLRFTIEESRAAPTQALQDALVLPDQGEPIVPNVACDLVGRPLLHLIMADRNGDGFHQRIPITWCRDPRDEVTRAVDAMTWTTTDTFTVEREVS